MEVIPQRGGEFFFKGMIKGYFGYFLLPKAILRTSGELHQAGADNIIRLANWTSYLKATMYKADTNVLQAM